MTNITSPVMDAGAFSTLDAYVFALFLTGPLVALPMALLVTYFVRKRFTHFFSMKKREASLDGARCAPLHLMTPEVMQSPQSPPRPGIPTPQAPSHDTYDELPVLPSRSFTSHRMDIPPSPGVPDSPIPSDYGESAYDAVPHDFDAKDKEMPTPVPPPEFFPPQAPTAPPPDDIDGLYDLTG